MTGSLKRFGSADGGDKIDETNKKKTRCEFHFTLVVGLAGCSFEGEQLAYDARGGSDHKSRTRTFPKSDSHPPLWLWGSNSERSITWIGSGHRCRKQYRIANVVLTREHFWARAGTSNMLSSERTSRRKLIGVPPPSRPTPWGRNRKHSF